MIIRKKITRTNAHNALEVIPVESPDWSINLLQFVPTDEMQQNILANEMLHWVFKTSDAYCLEEFPLSKMMSPTQFYALADTNIYFKHCFDFAKWAISFRLKSDWRRGKPISILLYVCFLRMTYGTRIIK